MGFFSRKKDKEAQPQLEYILMSDGKECQPTAPPAGFMTGMDAGTQPPDGMLFGSAAPLYEVEQPAPSGMLFSTQSPYEETPSADMLFGATQEQPLFFAQEQEASVPDLFGALNGVQEEQPAEILMGTIDTSGNAFEVGSAQDTTQAVSGFSGFFDLDTSDTTAAANSEGTDFSGFFQLNVNDMAGDSTEETAAGSAWNGFFAVGTEPIAEVPVEPQNAEPVAAEENPFAGFFGAEPIAEAPVEPQNAEPVAAEENPFAGFFGAEPIAEAPVEPQQNPEPIAEAPVAPQNPEPVAAEENPFAGFFGAEVEPIAEAPVEPQNPEPVAAEENPFAGFFGAEVEPIAEAPVEPQSAEPVAAEENAFAGFFGAEPIAEAPVEPQSAEPVAAEENAFAGFFGAEPIAEAPVEPQQNANQAQDAGDDVFLKTADSDVDDIFASFFGDA